MDSAWNLVKNANLMEIVAEVNNVKISITDFKTIDGYASHEDCKTMCRFAKENGNGNFHIGWLNDQVCLDTEKAQNAHKNFNSVPFWFCFNKKATFLMILNIVNYPRFVFDNGMWDQVSDLENFLSEGCKCFISAT